MGEDNVVRGIIAAGPSRPAAFATDKTVIATGGIGGLFADSTNPLSSFGQGLALAARAGAVMADMEFVQFHPTALDATTRPTPLISEAVRGEGGRQHRTSVRQIAPSQGRSNPGSLYSLLPGHLPPAPSKSFRSGRPAPVQPKGQPRLESFFGRRAD